MPLAAPVTMATLSFIRMAGSFLGLKHYAELSEADIARRILIHHDAHMGRYRLLPSPLGDRAHGITIARRAMLGDRPARELIVFARRFVLLVLIYQMHDLHRRGTAEPGELLQFRLCAG